MTNRGSASTSTRCWPRAIPTPSTRSTAPGRRCGSATVRCNGRKSAQQNADKFRACARAPSASAVPFASGIAPLRVWRTVNVHPPCPDVNTPALDRRAFAKSLEGGEDDGWVTGDPLGAGGERGLRHPQGGLTAEQVDGGGAQQAHDGASGVGLEHMAILPERVIFDVEEPILDAPMGAAEGQQPLRAGLLGSEASDQVAGPCRLLAGDQLHHL